MTSKEMVLDLPETSELMAKPKARPRLLYLDNLRTVLITGVVLGHLAVTYGAFGDWYYYESGETISGFYIFLLLVMAIGANFAMGLFFTIAGYFTPPAYDRKGAGRFLVDRLKRLGIPWLFYEIFINPFIHYVIDVHGGECHGALYDCQYQGTLWQYLKEYPGAKGSIGDGPVWFLEALLIFSIFYALWRIIAGSAIARVPGKSSRNRAVPGDGSIALFALFIGLSTFVLRIWVRSFIQYEPLHLEFGRFPQYIALFLVGMWAYRGNWFTSFTDHQARTWRWITLGCVLTVPVLAVAAGALSDTLDERATGGMNWLSLAFSLWEGFLCVAMVIVILTWFRRRFNHPGRLARAMSKSAFAVYIIHPAIIVPLALALSDLQMNLSLKFLFVAPLAVTLCFLVAYALRNVAFVRSVLG